MVSAAVGWTGRTGMEGESGLRPLGRGILLTTDFPPVLGGISSYLFNVYRQFDLSGMTLIAPKHARAAAFDEEQNYAAARYAGAPGIPGMRTAWQVWQMYAAAEKLVKRDRELMLHCGHVNAAIAARKLKRWYGMRYLGWTHAVEIMDEWRRAKIGGALGDADLVITNSEYTRAFVKSAGVEESKIVKVRPGADAEHFRPGMDASGIRRRLGIEGRPTLLTVARMVKVNRYKGHDVVLRALARVVKAVPDVAYVMVGEGDDVEYLAQLARERGVQDNVVFAGRLKNEELPFIYNACDAFIMCSREDRTRRGVWAEGFGLALVEASACGKPVIAGRSGGVPDAVREGVTGLLVDPTDEVAVAAAIVKILRERELAETLGRNGRAWVEREMNWDRAGDEFELAMQDYFAGVERDEGGGVKEAV